MHRDSWSFVCVFGETWNWSSVVRVISCIYIARCWLLPQLRYKMLVHILLAGLLANPLESQKGRPPDQRIQSGCNLSHPSTPLRLIQLESTPPQPVFQWGEMSRDLNLATPATLSVSSSKPSLSKDARGWLPTSDIQLISFTPGNGMHWLNYIPTSPTIGWLMQH